MGGGEEDGELIDLFLGEDLLHDADEEVRREDDDKEELRDVGTREDERRRDEHAQKVEEGADVADEDARVRLGVPLVDVVEQKLVEAALHLLFREPLLGRGRKALGICIRGELFELSELAHELLPLLVGRGEADAAAL